MQLCEIHSGPCTCVGGMPHSNACTVSCMQLTQVLKLIPAIVATRRVCRMFTRPPPSSGATSQLTTSFND
eukprot:12926098-Prorocentrum_lima.AAC.1